MTLPTPPIPDDAPLDDALLELVDGALSPTQTVAFERRLLEPAVSRALSEALLFRQLVTAAPTRPGDVPRDLVARIERELGVAEGHRLLRRRRTARSTLAAPEPKPRPIRDTLRAAFTWTRLPGFAVAGSSQGMSTLGYSLAALPAPEPQATLAPAPRPTLADCADTVARTSRAAAASGRTLARAARTSRSLATSRPLRWLSRLARREDTP